MAALPRLTRPAVAQVSSLLKTSQPAVLLGLLDRWPALGSWQRSSSYGSLRTLGEGRLVDVEWGRKGRGFLDDGEKGKSRIDLGLYLDAFLLDRVPSSGRSSSGSTTSDQGSGEDQTVFYVAQQDLLSDIPGLRDEVPSPAFDPNYPTLAGRGEVWRSNVWIGPEGTFTPIHRDPYQNLFCQLASSKTFFLYPPSTDPQGLYLARPPQHQTSCLPVAPHLVDLGAFPAFAAARAAEVRVVLRPGESLLLPEGWWHAVLAEDVEAPPAAGSGEGRISVNWWFL